MKKYGSFIWGGILILISAFLLFPATNKIYLEFNTAHPFILAFIKFGILASMGELIAVRIQVGEWKVPKGFAAKAFVWGVIGLMVVFMFNLFPKGVLGMMDVGYLPSGSGWTHVFFFGFFTSAIMNVTFGPVFMALHRISDTFIEERADGQKPTIVGVIHKIKWDEFILFVVAKTVPFFWIPAHTITFFFPENYRVVVAAYLSIALGVILSLSKKRKVKK